MWAQRIRTPWKNPRLSRGTILLWLTVFLTLGAGETQALECGNPQLGDTSVECTSSSDTDDVIVNVQGVTDITATGSDGISGILDSTAHNRSNNVDITVTDTTIITNGSLADGIYGLQNGSTGNVDITATGTTITTNGSTAHGIYGEGSTNHTGNINIEAIGSNITTNSNDAYGINVQHQGMSGNIDITATDTIITTNDLLGYGIHAWVLDPDNDSDIGITINLQNVEITTEGTQTLFGDTISHGVFVEHEGSGGDIVIDANAGTSITTKGTFSTGIFGKHEGTDDIRINVHGDASIRTEGDYSYGLYGDHRASGDVHITTAPRSSITTTGASAHGIVAYQRSTTDPGAIDITVGGTINTSGNAQGVRVGTVNSSGAPERVAAIGADGYRQQTVTINGSVTSAAEGVYLVNGGKVVIGPQGSIASGSGIAILATGTVPEDTTDPNNVIPAILPKLRVDLNLGGRRVAQAIGDDWILNDGGETTVAVNNVVLHEGAMGVVEGAVARNGAWNVRMREEGVTVDRTDPANWTTETATTAADRDFSAQDFNESRRPTPPPPPPPPPPAPELSVHRVNEPVFGGPGEAAGIIIEGDGEVYIGPEGSVGAESGIAILATESAPELLVNSNLGGPLAGDVRSVGAESGHTILATGSAPKLLVDLTLDGRRMADVIWDDWIINDGGETTIVVNDVTLHDGTDGVVSEAVAPNGAWNVRIREDGVTVTDYRDPDPANWTVTDPAAGVIADRDFSTEDFIEDPAGEPGSPVFMEEYAPRAAVYEALPDFLLRLTGPGPNRKCRTAPEERVWVRFAGGQGSYEADRSTTGATYDLERFETEGGFSANFNDKVRGWPPCATSGLGGRDVAHGRRSDRRAGAGLLGGCAWTGATGAYATGCFSYLAYDVDFASSQAGLLKAGVDSRAFTLDFETGLPFALTEQVQLTRGSG